MVTASISLGSGLPQLLKKARTNVQRAADFRGGRVAKAKNDYVHEAARAAGTRDDL